MKKLDKISTLQSIDWGLNHCIFVDKKNRVFSFGSNINGKLGLGEPDYIEDDQSSASGYTTDSEEIR